ncbi:hypothetical protein Pelo_7964 [Pelomyxa schiedti]|nr:hypothetical protein Pelo_7964 [Pelomyxa schiedti]
MGNFGVSLVPLLVWVLASTIDAADTNEDSNSARVGVLGIGTVILIIVAGLSVVAVVAASIAVPSKTKLVLGTCVCVFVGLLLFFIFGPRRFQGDETKVYDNVIIARIIVQVILAFGILIGCGAFMQLHLMQRYYVQPT